MRKLSLFMTVLVLGLVGLVGSAAAQVNTEKLRSKKRLEGVHGFFEGAVTWQTGNTELLAAGVGARIEYNYKVHHPFLQGSYLLGQKDDEKYLHNGFVHARWPAMWHPRVGSEVFTQLQFDEFKLLNLRYLAGAGVRVAALLHKIVTVHIGTGYMFEYEKLDIEETVPPDPHPNETRHHRWTSYVSLRVDISKWVKLTNIAYVQPRFDRFSDVRFLEDLSLVVTIYKKLKLVTSFVLEYDSDPPRTVEKLDTLLLTKLRFAF